MAPTKKYKTQRRFIAGAICPACKTPDSLYVSIAAAAARRSYDRIFCADCTYTAQRPTPAAATAAQPIRILAENRQPAAKPAPAATALKEPAKN